jgi:hypothetical protein
MPLAKGTSRLAGEFRLKSRVQWLGQGLDVGAIQTPAGLIAALLSPFSGFCLWPRGKTKAIETARTRNQVALGHQTPPLAPLECALTLERTALGVIA